MAPHAAGILVQQFCIYVSLIGRLLTRNEARLPILGLSIPQLREKITLVRLAIALVGLTFTFVGHRFAGKDLSFSFIDGDRPAIGSVLSEREPSRAYIVAVIACRRLLIAHFSSRVTNLKPEFPNVCFGVTLVGLDSAVGGSSSNVSFGQIRPRSDVIFWYNAIRLALCRAGLTVRMSLHDCQPTV